MYLQWKFRHVDREGAEVCQGGPSLGGVDQDESVDQVVAEVRGTVVRRQHHLHLATLGGRHAAPSTHGPV